MARVGRPQKGYYGTFSNNGNALDLRITKDVKPKFTKDGRLDTSSTAEARAEGQRKTDALNRIMDDAFGKKEMATKTEAVAAPQNSPEDRYVNRMRAGDSQKTDAELRQQFRDKNAASKGLPPPNPPSMKKAAKALDKAADYRKLDKATLKHVAKNLGMVTHSRTTKRDMVAAIDRKFAATGGKPNSRAANYFSDVADSQKLKDAIAKAHKDVASAGKARSTPKRQAAVDAYKNAFGTAPAKSMTTGKMNARVAERAAFRERIGDFQLNTRANAPADMAHVAERSAASNPAPATPKGPGTARHVMNAYAKAQPALAAYSAGVQAAHAYHLAKAAGKSHGEAAGDALKAAALPAAFAAAPVVEKAAGAVSRGGYAVARGMWESGMVGSVPDLLTGGKFGTMPMMAGYGVGIVGKGVQVAAKVAGRVALPAAVGFGVYQGIKEDSNDVRGAVRGAIRSLDPTALFMARGFGERGFDAMFGQATPDAAAPKRLTSAQQGEFAAANAGFGATPGSTEEPKPAKKGGRGFANAATQKAAQEARGVQNITAWAQSGDHYPGGA